MRMKASISSHHSGLRLRDLRRLHKETIFWSENCLLLLESGMNDIITVIEEDQHRSEKKTP